MIFFKKYYIKIFAVLSVLVLVSQVLLLNDNIKNKISFLYNMESQYVYSESAVPKGYIKIEISHPDKNVYILQNGEPLLCFEKVICKIDVFDNSVIEIDARNSDNEISVKLIEFSDNIDGYYEKICNLSKEIKILGRFFIK